MAYAPIQLEQLYEEYFSKIYNYFFYRLLKREETEDLTSTVFLKIARSAASYDGEKAQVGTWVYTIAANTLRDYYRTRKLNVSLDDENFAGKEPTEDFEAQYDQILSPKRRALFKALSTLSEEERALVYQKYFLGAKNRELSARLGMNESTVGSILVRARKKLRKVLEDEGSEYVPEIEKKT